MKTAFIIKRFGTTFDPNHDWCTTTSGVVTINGIPSSVSKVQLLAYVADNDTTTSMTVLNEIANPTSQVTINYDAPSNNLGLYVAFVSGNGYSIKKVNANTISFVNKASTRGIEDYVMPSDEPVISVISNSYANERGWNEGEKLYQLADYSNRGINVSNYSDEDIASFRALIFSYF